MRKLKLSKQFSASFLFKHTKNMREAPFGTCAEEEAFEYVNLLKTCGKQKDLFKGSQIHTHIAGCGFLDHNVFLGSALISMYAKCGVIDKAQQVFDELPVRNEVSWNALIAAYAQQGQCEEALNCFKRMQSSCFPPDAFTFSCILKSCGSVRALDKGQEIHAQVVRKALLETDIVLASSLVDMYIKCGALQKAQEVFVELPSQDRVLWTALIAGYCEHGLGVEAISIYEQMQLSGFNPDAVTFICILKACGSIQDCDKGEAIHSQIVRMCLLGKDLRLGTALVDMYAKCGAFEKAQEVFDELGTRDVVSWNAMITGCAQLECAGLALKSYQQMQLEGFCPTPVTFACILKACGSLNAQEKGQEVHAQIAKEHLQEEDAVVGNALVDMYAKCGALTKAQEVFDELLFRDKVSWTSLIAGYALHGHGEEAISWFEHMQEQGFSADAVTLSCILKVCGSMGALEKGGEIHAQFVTKQVLEREIVVANALLYMYAKCGALEKAQEVFNKLPIRSVVTWNTMIALHAQKGRYEEAMLNFEQMQCGHISPDTITFICMLKACGCAGAAYLGQVLHCKLAKFGLLDRDTVGNALVAMYSNCGMLVDAHELFHKLPDKDIALWSTLMLGYSQLGKDEVVFSLLDSLIGKNLEPNSVILTVLLNTCSHRGLVDMGQMCFERISKDYGIIPTIEHYTCIIDLLCRACHPQKAVLVVNEMPLFPDLSMWHTVLGACQKWGLMKLGNWAFEHALEVDDTNAATYVSMGNIFVAAGKQRDADKIRFTRPAEKRRKPCWSNNECQRAYLLLEGDVKDNFGYEEPEHVDMLSKDVCLPNLHILARDNGVETTKDTLWRTKRMGFINNTHPKASRCILVQSKASTRTVNVPFGYVGFTDVQSGGQWYDLPLCYLELRVCLQRLLVMTKWSYVISVLISLGLSVTLCILDEKMILFLTSQSIRL